MTKPSDDLKAIVIQSSSNETAECDHLAIGSADDVFDDDAEVEWDEELTRRVREIEDGKAIGRPAFEVLDEISEKYR